ncbi:MAG TPA: hypothetical protein ENK35_06270 [Candidatus Tenderia sp.]|nr:hypothetical protein [Candidatus Tenderia sp.]
MKKNVIAMAVAAAMVPGFAAAADSKVSGFGDIYYTNDSDSNLSVFTANAEVDFASKLSDIVSVRADVDLSLSDNTGTSLGATTGGPQDGVAIEQAFFAAGIAEGVTLIGGVFNNPIGWEAEDVTDRYAITATKNYEVLDGQTALWGNNIAGVAVAGDLGPVTVTGAVLNDIGLAALDKHSMALVVNATPVAGLDVELGYVTQEAQAGNVTNLNATYRNAGLTLGLEYMTAEEALDTGITAMANYMFTPAVGATVQYSSLDGDGFGSDADTRLSVAGIWNIADNLSVLAEYNNDDNGDGADNADAINLEFIAKF